MSDANRFQEFLGIETRDGELTVRTDERHTNAAGTVQGGLIATLVDMAMGHAVRSGLKEGQSAATLQLSVAYLNAAEPGDTLIASAHVGKRGDAVLLLSATVSTGEGKDISEAVGTFTITSQN